MEHQQYITTEGECLCFRPHGAITIARLLKWLEQLGNYSLENGHTRVLVDTTNLTHEVLTGLERYQLGAGVANVWPSTIRLSMFSRSDQIDPRRFGQMVAANRGLFVGVFDDEAEALEWLKRSHGPVADDLNTDIAANNVLPKLDLVLTNST